MKIKPQQFAQILVESATADNLKVVAKNFWRLLQKNKQYKDLPRILELIDEEYARQNNKTLVKVYSEKELDPEQLIEIKDKLSLRGSISDRSNLKDRRADVRDDIIVKNIVQKNCGGITIRIDDKIIDFSTIGKVEKLKAKLTNIT